MISCDLRGGLGNQLFQIFAVISYTMKTNTNYYFKIDDYLYSCDSTIRKTYWCNFLSKIENINNDFTDIRILGEPGFFYTELPCFPETINIMLYGYFQSYKYFQENYIDICKIIDLDGNKQKVFNKMNSMNLENTISIHFRLGDYKHLQQYHPIMPYEYYKKALTNLLKKDNINQNELNILYLCEDEDVHIVGDIIYKLTQDFPNINMERGGEYLEDWEQMLLMSLCKYNIIANSTFSWWGAYFNSNPDKIVCYPAIWFGPEINHNTDDLFPADWIKIE